MAAGRGGPAAAAAGLALGLGLGLAGPGLGGAASGLAAALALAAAAHPGLRGPAARLAAGLLGGALAALAVHLLGDHFGYRYVWLYSAAELPWHLKLAGLWGGEEGTLLGLAAGLALAALRLARTPGWGGPGALALTALFAAAATRWSPFAPTPAADLARAASAGLNAHLLRVWMVVHPPLVLLAYVWVLAPAGAALEALVRGAPAWGGLAARWSRAAWLLLGAGLAAGMWWAFEDYTFGQFWHWDPVQTSVFVLWALLGAQLHGLRRYRPDGFLARLAPLLALLAAAAVPAAMAVTRSELLASSHRYLGAGSRLLFAGLAATLTGAALGGWALALRRPLPGARAPAPGQGRLITGLAIALFAGAALMAAGAVAQAWANGLAGAPRPGALRPFFETLARWASPEELAALRRAFAQWDIDNLALNRWLAPLGALVGLLGGHAFLALRRAWLGWVVTAAAGLAALAVAVAIEPLGRLYTGTGLTSAGTVANFFWLDVLLAALAYLALGAAVWSARCLAALRRGGGAGLAVGAAHLGVVLALAGALAASVLDSYASRRLRYPDDLGRPQRLADGYTLTVELEPERRAADGAAASGSAYRGVARVRVALARGGGEPRPIGAGQAVYRDERPRAARADGPVRQLCALVDYRYARYTARPARTLDPFIVRGAWRDVQVWVPPLGAGEPGAPGGGTITVVVKTFPLLSWLWAGLALLLGATLAITVRAWRR